MCFNVSRKHPDSLITQEDIICYKSSDTTKRRYKTFSSDYRRFDYKLGKVYRLMTSLEPTRKVELYPEPRFAESQVINQGFHSYIKIPTQYLNDRLVECIIPKGSTYYINPDENEYVSDQIIIKRYMSFT